jgi:bifunctional non-homologous end joining protein LigD
LRKREATAGIRLSEHLDGADGQAVFRHACALGAAGIVAKPLDRPYRSGRSPEWIRVKNPDAPAVHRLLGTETRSGRQPIGFRSKGVGPVQATRGWHPLPQREH